MTGQSAITIYSMPDMKELEQICKNGCRTTFELDFPLLIDVIDLPRFVVIPKGSKIEKRMARYRQSFQGFEEGDIGLKLIEGEGISYNRLAFLEGEWEQVQTVREGDPIGVYSPEEIQDFPKTPEVHLGTIRSVGLYLGRNKNSLQDSFPNVAHNLDNASGQFALHEKAEYFLNNSGKASEKLRSYIGER